MQALQAASKFQNPMTPWPTLDQPPPGVSETAPADSTHDRPTASISQPFVHDDGQAKSLHFTMGELQSRMNKLSPWQLEVDYTRTMMGFLLLRPQARRIAMVGLGGGSLAKFCYRQLSNSHMTVLEINPQVIALRREFCVPDDDDRFEVLQADGAAFVAAQNASFEVLLIDGFDQDGQPEALCSQRFYDDCFAALAPDGVLVVNLHYDSSDYPLWAERIRRSFGGNAVEVPATEKSNCIVFASRGAPISPRDIKLPASLSRLDRQARSQLKPEFARIVWSMKDLSTLAD